MSSIRKLSRDASGRLAAFVGVDRIGRRRTWLAVLFHHLTDEKKFPAADPRIKGLGIDLPVGDFERAIAYLQSRYEVSTLNDVISQRPSSKRRLVICFDDAYASVPQLAAPILAERGLPWIFFVNPGLIDSSTAALDNLLAYAFNTLGADRLAAIVGHPVRSLDDVIQRVLPSLRYSQRLELENRVGRALATTIGMEELREGLYTSMPELEALVKAGVEIGNHTMGHVHTRTLVGDEIAAEVVASAQQLRSMVTSRVRTFAYPYGSQHDAIAPVRQALLDSDHDLSFVVQGRLNNGRTSREMLNRVSLRSGTSGDITCQTELLPRLRSLRAALTRGRLGRSEASCHGQTH
jgi:peptidoglycan/xylan/chitin deacetylase (PgdA/CDA1 family)